jgi:hypothetical protein
MLGSPRCPLLTHLESTLWSALRKKVLFSTAASQKPIRPVGSSQAMGRDTVVGAAGNCTNPFRDRVLNRFWAWRSGMRIFSNVANQCHFVPPSTPSPMAAVPTCFAIG